MLTRTVRLLAPLGARGMSGMPGRPVYVSGQGQVPVTRKAQGITLESMGAQAIHAAIADARIDKREVESLYVGNMMSGMLSKQQHLGPLLANAAGLDLVEAATAEACCGSGGAALRWGVQAIASGFAETVIVAGTELMTHVDGPAVTESLATASHWATEGGKGETFVSLNGTLMREYMKRYNLPHVSFAAFALTAHQNATSSSIAVFRGKALTKEAYESAQVVTPPIQLYDASPTCDGAAAVVLTSNADKARRPDGSLVRILGSGAASDLLRVADRPDPLVLRAVRESTRKAMSMAGVSHADIDIFELHDAYTSMACLSLENAGFVAPGEGCQFAAEGHIALGGKLPIATFGGLKARGHPVGATGVYQAAEMYLQLTKRAGKNQVSGAKVAMTQNIGGSGASIFTHVFASV